MKSKRLATPEEVEQILLEHVQMYDSHNEDEWRTELAKAESEGYLNEVCECGCVFLAFHHFILCKHDECPFRCGKTIFEMWQEQIDNEQHT